MVTWSVSTQVMPRGRVTSVSVTEEAVRGAREEHLRGVWGATEGEWWNRSIDAMIAKKSEGEAGLQKVMEFGKKWEDVAEAEFATEEAEVCCCAIA